MSKEQSPETSQAASLVPDAPAGLGRQIVTVVAIAAVVLAVATVWSVPRPTGDLYVGLAAGRDIMQGKLGQVDDWAFTTEGRVWINQNWGTNLAYYVSHELAGETGLLALKALMLMAGTGFLIFACRRRDASWPVAMIVSAGVIAAGRSFIDLRPNLTTLMFVPVMLHLLYRTAERPRRIWLAMLVFGVIWANLHGGFTLGLLAMFFWAFCVVILPIFGRERLSAWVPGVAIAGAVAASVHYIRVGASTVAGLQGPELKPVSFIPTIVVFLIALGMWYFIRWNVKKADFASLREGVSIFPGGSFKASASAMLGGKWAYLAAAFGAVVLAGVVTPYGIHNAFRDFSKLTMPFWEMWNLTHPIVVTIGKDSDIWRSVIEWNSIFTASASTFGTSWEFFGIVGLFCTLVPLQVAIKLYRKRLLDVEDYVLLAVIIAVCVAIVAQAEPVRAEFARAVDTAVFRGTADSIAFSGVMEQYHGWTAAMICFPLLALFAVGVSIAAVTAWFGRRQMSPFSAERIGIVVFDVCIAAGGIKLAFGSRRFMPLALMLLAPLLARRMQWLVGWLGDLLTSVIDSGDAPADKKAGSETRSHSPGMGLLWHMPAIIVGLAVLITISAQARDNYNRYRTDSPLVRYKSVLKNMIVYQMFSPYARDFIRDNDLSGRCFNEWRWEGYLRWYCPKLKMFIGGRAQQAYAIDTYKVQRAILGGDLSPTELEKLKVRWIVVPWSGSYVPLMKKCVYAKGAVWVPVFCDGENLVLANSRLPECQDTIRKCEAGAMKYSSKAIEHFSRAMCLSSAKVNRREEAIRQIKESQQAAPIPMAYSTMGDLCGGVKYYGPQINYLEGENRRLAGMDYEHLNGSEILRCRAAVLNMLGRYYHETEQRFELDRISREIGELNELMDNVYEEWN